jgi:NTE family protein
METPQADKFIAEIGIETEIENFREAFKNKKFSDVLDPEGHQYVDLVQQGGGVWGVSLIGFVYVMEQVGIRFFNLAGTSAGAINAMAMAAINNKEEKKSKIILELFLNLELDKLMDGKHSQRFTRFIRRLIGRFIKNPGYAKKLQYTILILIVLLALTSIAGLALFFTTIMYQKPINISALVFWVTTIFLGISIAITLNKIKNGLGLNEGIFFHDWVTNEILKGKNLEDLKAHFGKVPNGLYVDLTANHREPTEIAPKTPRLAFVAADITTQNKIEFPRMWELYYPNLKSVNPADFVRASMSIPIFFNAYSISPKPFAADSWDRLINWNNQTIPQKVLLVDGGSLSNFPINIFHNPKNKTPRMPTIGIRLIENEDEKDKNFIIKSLTDLLGKIINTMKLSSDKEFINKNPSYNKGIAYVKINKELSWLNFFMTESQKKELFVAGAQSAISFLIDFDWEVYKEERFNELTRQIDTLNNNPNNW